MVDHDLPVKVGQMAESKSLLKGFRGAWFRCKIRDITERVGDLYVYLEYIDYPDEKLKQVKLYQKIPSAGVKTQKKQLMVRPSFPPIYKKSEKPCIGNFSELAIIVEDEWRVGDHVDWWTTGCFWSGRITKLLNNEMVQVELFPPPEGEGMTYDAYKSDLRPSLEWSPDGGWALPTIKVDGHIRHCCQLIKNGIEGIPVEPAFAGEAQRDVNIGGSSSSSAAFCIQNQSKLSSPTAALIPDVAPHAPRTTSGSKRTLASTSLEDRKASSSDTKSKFGMQEDEIDSSAALEKLKSDSTVRLNSMSSNTLEDAVLDLETLATRLKMFEDILKAGLLPNTDESRTKTTPK